MSKDQVSNNYKKESKKKKSRSGGRVVWSYIKTLIIAVIIVIFVLSFVIANARIPSGSMIGTIMPGDRVIANRLAYINSDPERYDIIVFKYPDDESELFIKRVIGLPGETIIVSNGSVYCVDSSVVTDDIDDDALLADPYMLPDTFRLDDSFIYEEQLGGKERGDGVYRIPEGSFFVLGDNRNSSRDSRFWNHKYVVRREIIGKAIFRYWPLNKMKVLTYEDD